MNTLSTEERERIKADRRFNKAVVTRVREILVHYDQGRAASSCMAEIKKLLDERA
jgi:hypothetical protein